MVILLVIIGFILLLDLYLARRRSSMDPEWESDDEIEELLRAELEEVKAD